MSRVAFFGTPPAAVPILRAVHQAVNVDFVVTRPDKPRGRSGTPQPSAVKTAALDLGVEVATPGRAEEIADRLDGLDAAVVVAYGQILPEHLLGRPTRGFVNVHFSCLPRWRGAAPVARAILAGDPVTGVDVIQLDAGMDTGPVLARAELPIEPDDTTGSLTARLSVVGADLLVEALPALLDGSLESHPQDETGACLAPKLTTEEARLDPRAATVGDLERAVRAFNPKPGAWGVVDGRRLKVWRVGVVADVAPDPGDIVVRQGRPILGATDGGLELIEVQPAGKSPMAGDVWARGQRGHLTWQ